MKKINFIGVLLLIGTIILCSCNASLQGSPSAASIPSTGANSKPSESESTIIFKEINDSSSKDDIFKIQERLSALGYLDTAADGIWGTYTQNAILRFQKQNQLTQSGVIDEISYEVLFSADTSRYLPLKGYIIGIDPGHQAKGNNGLEPVSPNSKETKKKVSSGTAGQWSGVSEYEVNIAVGLLLRDLLVEQGATVVMTRETNDVNITNIERAQFFNENKTDYALRLHCNGANNNSVHGAFMLVPTENPFLSECDLAAQLLIDSFCEETGAKNLGITKRNDQTGFNWCERMVINIEMGHMSNKEEDLKLADKTYQEKMAKGLLSGIIKFFEHNEDF